MPLALFLLGLGVGSAIKLSDGVTAVIALLCLALGYLAARAIDKKLRSRPRWKTAVVNVYPMNKNK